MHLCHSFHKKFIANFILMKFLFFHPLAAFPYTFDCWQLLCPVSISLIITLNCWFIVLLQTSHESAPQSASFFRSTYCEMSSSPLPGSCPTPPVGNKVYTLWSCSWLFVPPPSCFGCEALPWLRSKPWLQFSTRAVPPRTFPDKPLLAAWTQPMGSHMVAHAMEGAWMMRLALWPCTPFQWWVFRVHVANGGF